jgi:protein-S-isoprenylcysteine O-methyltransferase Ste14
MPNLRWIDIAYGWRVRSALFVLIAILVLARPTGRSIVCGIAICALGLFIRGWAAGHIKKEKELAVSGPYRHTRNPLYLGNFVLGLSIAIGTNSVWCILLFLAYFLAFYPPVILEERERMRRLFPKEYEDYKKKVPAFLPRLRRLPHAGDPKFSSALYLKNREYRALLGSVLIWAILIAKMIWGRGLYL